MKINFTEFRSCSDLPKQDGRYLVIKFNEKGGLSYASDINYTVKYGWNTFECAPDNPIVFEPYYYWAVATEEQEDNNEETN